MTLRMARPGIDFDLAIQRAHDSRGERLIQAEGVADGERHLADLQLRRAADADRLQQVGGRIDRQHREVLGRIGSDQATLPAGAVGEDDHGAAGVADDVVVGDDVAILVPHETGTGALRDLLDVQAERRRRGHQRRDVHDRRRGRPEDLDRGLLDLGQIAARRDRPRDRVGVHVAPGFRNDGPDRPQRQGRHQHQQNGVEPEQAPLEPPVFVHVGSGSPGG